MCSFGRRWFLCCACCLSLTWGSGCSESTGSQGNGDSNVNDDVGSDTEELDVGGEILETGDSGNLDTGMWLFEIDADHVDDFNQQSFTGTWRVLMQTGFDNGTVAGHATVVGFDLAGEEPRTLPSSMSVEIAGTGNSGGFQLAAFDIPLPDSSGDLNVESFVVQRNEVGAYTGEGSGEFNERSGEHYDYYVWTGTITGAPDTVGPKLFLINEVPLLGFDQVIVQTDEPMDVSSAQLSIGYDDVDWPFEWTVTSDPLTEAATAFIIVPDDLWPSDQELTLTIAGVTDQAGNPAADTAMVLNTFGQPDSAENLGFELGLQGWIGIGLAGDLPRALFDYVYYDEEGDEQSMLPAEGVVMAYLPPSSRLAGYISRASGSNQRLSMRLAMANMSPISVLQDQDQGMTVTLISAAGPRVALSTDDLEAEVGSLVTGFELMSIDLDEAEKSGFWIVFETTSYQPPVNFPELLVDDLSLQ